MKRTALPTLVAVVGLLAGASLALAGGGKCTSEHTQADYQKMAEKMAQKGWLGIETEKSSYGYTITSVAEGSPAERAGFRTGDVLVAMNGVELNKENKEALHKVKSSFAPGKKVKYTVRRDGDDRELTATLGEVPREVLAQWLGEHVLDHTSVVVASTN